MLEVICQGNVYNLDDGTLSFFLDHDGLGIFPITRFSSRGNLQEGDTDLGFRAEPRIFRLKLLLTASSLMDWFTSRRAILSVFPPGEQLGVRFTIGSFVRQLDAFYLSDMSMPSAEKFGNFGQTVLVTLKANDPSFYDPQGLTATFALWGGSGGGIPMDVPTNIGASTINQDVTIEYLGNWMDYPRIRINGPISNAIITNNTTGDILDFTGTTIAAGDWYDIDTRFGYKTVMDAAGNDKQGNLTANSDLATFHLAPTTDASQGMNSLSVTGENATGATRIDVHYYHRYYGL